MAASFFDAFTDPKDQSGFSRIKDSSSVTHTPTNDTPQLSLEAKNQSSVYQDYLPEWKLVTDTYRAKKLALHQHMTSQLEKLCALEDKFEKMSGDFHGKVEGAYDQLSTELDGWQDILEADQDRHTHEKAVIHQVWRLQEERIKLNVGGQYFETSLSTLRRDPNSMLAAMFSGNGMISRDPDGSYFIDRDSTYFRLVLNYLRDLRIPPSVQEDSKIMEELMQEAMFYRIKDLLKLRWANLSVITQEGLWKVYPVESTRTLLHFVDKDLSNLDFSGYRLDSRSCFSGCNLENSSFGSAWFIADAEHAMDFTNSFMWGTQFPALGSAQRPFGVQIRFDGAVVDEMIA